MSRLTTLEKSELIGIAIVTAGGCFLPEFSLRVGGLTQPWFTLGVAAVLVAGFLIKDFVFQWSPWRIYREKNHATLHFRWRR